MVYRSSGTEKEQPSVENKARNHDEGTSRWTGFKLTGPIIYRAVVSCSRLWLFLHVRVVCLLDFMDPGKLMPRPPA